MSRIEVERLRAFRKGLGINQTDFAQSLGIKQGSYSDIERGKVGISGDIMKVLVRKYHLNLLWLYEGIPPQQIPLGRAALIDLPSGESLSDEFFEDKEELRSKINHLIDSPGELHEQIRSELKQLFTKLLNENDQLKNKLIKLYETQDQTVEMLNRLMALSNKNP